MTRIGKFAGLSVLVLGGLLVVSTLGLWIALRTEFGQQLIRNQVAALLQSSIAADIQVGEVGGVFGYSFEVRNLRIAVGGRTVVRIPRVRIAYALLELLRGRIVLRHVTVERPWVRMVRGNGHWVVPTVAEGSGQGSGIPVHIERLEILRGRFEASWDEAGSWRKMAATDLHLESSLIVGAKRQEVRVGRLAFVPRGVAVSPVNVSGAVVRKVNGSICLVDLVLATNRSQLSVSGCIDPANAVSARLSLEPLDPGEARALFGQSVSRTKMVAIMEARGPWHGTQVVLRADLGAGGELKGQATLDLESQPVRYQGSVGFTQLDPWALFARGAPCSFNGRARVWGAGFGDDASARWRLTLEPSEVAGQQVNSLRMSGTSARGAHSFIGRVRGPAGIAGVRGRVSMSPVLSYDLVSRMQLEQLETILPGLPGRGRSAFSLLGRGLEPDDRAADLRATLAAAAIKDVVVDRARLHAKLDGERLSLESLSVQGPGLEGMLRGGMDLPTRTIDFTLDAALALRRLGAALDWPLAGKLEATGSVRGPLDALAVDASVTGTELGWGATRAGQATVTLDGIDIGGHQPAASAQVSIEELHVAGGKPRTARGSVSWTGTLREGEATVSAAAQVGDATTERVELHVTRAEGAIRGEIRELLLTPLEDEQWRLAAPVNFVVREGMSTQSLELRANEQTVTTRGRLSLDGENDAFLSLRRVDLAPICVALGLPECRGLVSAEATLSGTAAAPIVQVTGSSAGLQVESVDYGRFDIEAVYHDRVMSLEGVLRTPSAGRLDLDVAIPIDLAWAGDREDLGQKPLRARIHADLLDLAFLPVIMPRDVRGARGRVSLDLRLSGVRDAPRADGWIQLDDGSVEISRLGCRYDVGARLEVTGSRVSVVDLHAMSGKGTLEGSGWLEVGGDGGPRFSLAFLMDEFFAVRNRQYEAAMSGDVQLAGSLEAPEATGSLTVTRAMLRLPQFMPSTDPRAQPDPTIKVVGVTDRDAPAEPTPTGFDGPLRVGLDVRAEGNAWVRREDMNIEIAGQLRIEREPYQEPSIHGRLTLRRGWYAFQGRRFNVGEGTIIFLGKGTEPQIDVTGSYRAGEYTVFARVAGSGSKPSLELSSEPLLDEADILAVLLFGKPTGQLTGGQAASLQERTVALAGGYAVGELTGSVRDALGLDTLDVEIPGGAGGEGSVTVGRYVTKDVFVSFAQEFGASISEVVSVEYSITPRFSIRGSTSSLGQSTIDFLVSHRY